MLVYTCLSLCFVFGGYFILNPVLPCRLDSGRLLLVWPYSVSPAMRAALTGAGLLLALLCAYLCRHVLSQHSAVTERTLFVIRMLIPLALLPVSAAAVLQADHLPMPVVTNVLVFIPVIAVSHICFLLYQEVFWKRLAGVPDRRIACAIMLVSIVLYGLLGYYMTATVGEHSGDEGHYIIQAESLYRDHDLDLKNNLTEQSGEIDSSEVTRFRRYLHVAPNSTGDHWYSWHPYGLSLIAAPFWWGGLPVRHLLLAMISAFGLLGVFSLSRRLGATRPASVLSVIILGLSVYWCVYSSRFLPEVLGAALMLWTLWCIVSQKDRPWMTAVLVAVLCSFAPAAHVRFLPVGLLGMGFYGLAGLFWTGEALKKKVFRLSVFSALCILGIGLYLWNQTRMYSGGISGYEVKRVLFTYPMGTWAIFAGVRGLVSIFPVFIWILAAVLVSIVVGRTHRWITVSAAFMFLTTLFLTCASQDYTGGAALPGRYILVAVPILFPIGAVIIDRSSPAARWWFVFLGMISAALALGTFVFLPSLRKAFILPIQNLPYAAPVLRYMLTPYCTYAHVPPGFCRFFASTFVVVFFLATVIILLLPRRRWRYAVTLMIVTAAVGFSSYLYQLSKREKTMSPGSMARVLSSLDLESASVAGDTEEKVPLFSVSKAQFADFDISRSRAAVTTSDLGVRRKEGVISQPRLERNDWAGRDYGWTTLTAPFRAERGRRILHIAGSLSGDARPVFAIKEGADLLYEGPMKVNSGMVNVYYSFPARGKHCDIALLLRLEKGEGTFDLKEMYWSPYSDRFLDQANLSLPERVIFVPPVK